MSQLVISHDRYSGVSRGRLVAAMLAFLLVLTGVFGLQLSIGATQSSAADVAPTLEAQAYWSSSESFKGFQVDIRAQNASDATQVRVTAHRAAGGDVVKVNNPTGRVLDSIKEGRTVTAPIVIQSGTYDEAGSSSWIMPESVWTSDTVPTSVTVELLAGETVIASKLIESISTVKSTADEVMHGLPELRVGAYYTDGSYKGIGVDVGASNVADATAVRVIVHRTSGGDVVKVNNPAGGVLDSIKEGRTVTAPIVIQSGTYDEAGSSSWIMPESVWTSDTVPTSVTFQIVRANGSIIEKTVSMISERLATLEEVMPVTPKLTAVSAEFVETPEYSGVYVDFEVVGVIDATDVELRLNRADGTTYSVHALAPVLNAVNASADAYSTGGTVITLGSRTSSSWDPQVGNWNSASKLADSDPVTVVITLGNGDVIEKSIADKTSIRNSGIEDNIYPVVLPLGLTNSYAEYKNDAEYKGITVQIQSTGFTDAEQVIVQVDRSQGGPVQKISQPDAAFLSTINGDLSKEIRTTAPIVIQPGTYDENASSSWIKPGAVWTSETVPTSVTITVKRTSGSDVVKTIPLSAPPAGILPEPGATPVVTVPSQQPAGTPFVVDVPAGEVTNIGLGTTTGGSTLVSANLVINTPTGVSVNIPANTTVTGPATWDGVITAPYVVEDVTVPASAGKQATVALAIKVGSDAGQISFDKAVKVTLPGQAGNSAGFIDHNDTFHAITAECGESPENLSTGECWMNEGDDLVIWTTHFTTFVAYTITATGGGGEAAGTGGGALAVTGAADLTPALVAVGIMMMLGLGLILAGRLRRQGARR